MEKIENKSLISQIQKWNKINPKFNEAFEMMHSMIEAVDIVSNMIEFTTDELRNFIDGIFCMRLFLLYQDKDLEKEKFYSSEVERLTSPVISKLITYIKSDKYQDYIINQQITGEDKIDIPGIIPLISLKAIKLHANRMKKLILNVGDVEHVEIDLIRYKKGLYKDLNYNIDKNKSFSDCLISNDNIAIIEKINRLDKNKPMDIYIIIKALIENKVLIFNANEGIYKAWYKEFGYRKDFETLKRGLNSYDWGNVDKRYLKKIEIMQEYLSV